MPDYQLYLLTVSDHIDRTVLLTCDDDEQALAEMAINAVTAGGVELWQDQRLVRRVPPVGPIPET